MDSLRGNLLGYPRPQPLVPVFETLSPTPPPLGPGLNEGQVLNWEEVKDILKYMQGSSLRDRLALCWWHIRCPEVGHPALTLPSSNHVTLGKQR